MKNDESSRWLDTEAAARYLSVRPDSLLRLVRAGRLPKPHYALGPRSPRWDKRELDSALQGGESPTKVDAVVEEIVQSFRKASKRQLPHKP